MATTVRRLQSDDAGQLFELRRESLLKEPFAFLSSPEDDIASSVDAVRNQLTLWSDRSAVFGAFSEVQLIGMAGLTRDRPIKAAHRGCIWGVYVQRKFRREGAGKKLLLAALAHARQWPGLEIVYLSVSEKTPEAKRLYESVGFDVWGLEPDCIRVSGKTACEYHLSLKL